MPEEGLERGDREDGEQDAKALQEERSTSTFSAEHSQEIGRLFQARWENIEDLLKRPGNASEGGASVGA
eukprot:3397693-Pyramimonas_sp.AAC.1